MRASIALQARRWAAAIVLLAAFHEPATARENPLAPPDTSSPRATVSSFIAQIDEVFQIASSTPSAADRRNLLRPKARFLLKCFDDHELAPSTAESKCFQAAILLKEILDRIDVPPINQFPDADEVRDEEIDRFRIPGTEITLVKVQDGPRKGEFLFSTVTINEADDFFDQVRHLPYKEQASSKGLYKLYVGLQGSLVPATLIESLPSWARAPVYEHAIWQWVCLGLMSILALVVVAASYRIGRGPADRPTLIPRAVLQFVFPVVWIPTALALDMIFSTQIRMTGQVLITLKVLFRLQLFLSGIFIVLTALNRVADDVIHTQRLRPEAVDSQLVRLGFRLLTFLLVSWLVVLGADYMGIAITPLLAGLGVSGLAVALAAQHTIENLIAGIVLFADKPVRVGDFCRFGENLGTVEEIGLRSTRVRAVDRTVIAIPNAEFAKLQLINLTKRDRILLKTVLQLRYETTADQLRYVIFRVRQLLLDHPRVSNDPARVRFVNYGEYSLDVEIFAFAHTSDWSEFLSIQESLLLSIMDIVNEAGTGFAFPSQTEYQASDVTTDPDRLRAVETAVNSWREQGLLTEAGLAADPAPRQPLPPNNSRKDQAANSIPAPLGWSLRGSIARDRSRLRPDGRPD